MITTYMLFDNTMEDIAQSQFYKMQFLLRDSLITIIRKRVIVGCLYAEMQKKFEILSATRTSVPACANDEIRAQ